MSESLVATQALYVGNARAANVGDLVDAETAKNNGWTEKEFGLAKPGTVAANKAQGIEAEAKS